jgi:site-specific DNA recombinase
MQVVGYTRVSTEDQQREGISLSMQEAKIQAYASVKDWTVVEVIRDEGLSAKSLKRPGLQQLLALIEAGCIEGIIVYKLDRLTRRVRDLDDLVGLFQRKGVALVSLQESLDATTATGRLMMGFIALLSQWEREMIGERTRDAMQHLKSQGRRYCYAVFGERPEEAQTLAWMQAERAAGRSYEAIAELLNAAGVVTSISGRWQGNTVRRILLRTMPRQQRRVA